MMVPDFKPWLPVTEFSVPGPSDSPDLCCCQEQERIGNKSMIRLVITEKSHIPLQVNIYLSGIVTFSCTHTHCFSVWIALLALLFQLFLLSLSPCLSLCLSICHAPSLLILCVFQQRLSSSRPLLSGRHRTGRKWSLSSKKRRNFFFFLIYFINCIRCMYQRQFTVWREKKQK